MKVLWVSNAPWCSTGYGQQTNEVIPRLAQRYGTENVAVACLWGLAGGVLNRNGVTHYPQGLTPYSDDVIPAHAWHHFDRDRNAGMMITLFDTWVWENPDWQDFHVASWCPVDHMPTPPAVLQWFKRSGAIPIAMSRYGEERLRADGLEPLYAPHSIDVNVMKPTMVASDGRPVREYFGIPNDAYVVGMVAANKGRFPPRKSWSECFLAFSRFKKDHPEAILYIHSEPKGMTDGIPMDVLANMCGLRPEDLRITDQYAYRMSVPPPVMAMLYSTFDVLLSPSMGEGFGIPVIEAQACGVPVIVSDFSAQPELVGAGWKVGGQAWADIPQASWFQLPDVAQIVDSLEQCYARDTETVREDARKARQKAKEYDTPKVWSAHWMGVLDKLEKHIARNPKMDGDQARGENRDRVDGKIVPEQSTTKIDLGQYG